MVEADPPALVPAQADEYSALETEDSLPANRISNEQFFESTASMQDGQLELALRMRISQTEELLQKQRERLDELENLCAVAEEAEDDVKYAEIESRWEIVDANVTLLEKDLSDCNSIMQEKYYQQRVATAQSGAR